MGPPSSLALATPRGGRPPAARHSRFRGGKLGLAAALLAGFCWATAQDEVPFITTPDNVTLAMLQLAGVTAADRVLDLGSGDGRIVITAARRFGALGLGVEIVPDLVARSVENARKAGVADRATFRVQDLFETDLAGYGVITMYLLPEVNLQLRPRLLALPPGTRIVSHDWDMGDWEPERSLTVDAPDKPIGREKKSTLHLWRVPARVAGRWCAGGAELEITQRFQHFSASLQRGGNAAPLLVWDGRIDATVLRSLEPGSGTAGARTELLWHAGTLQVQRIASTLPELQRAVFRAGPCAGPAAG
jgi:SAM-dependent methyltransferase